MVAGPRALAALSAALLVSRALAAKKLDPKEQKKDWFKDYSHEDFTKFESAQGDSMGIAKQIKCDMCKEASRRITNALKAGKASKTGKPSTADSEEAVLEEVGSFCKGKDGEDSIDVKLDNEKWRVDKKSGDSTYRLRKGNHLDDEETRKNTALDVVNAMEAGRGQKNVMIPGWGQRQSIQEACHMAVGEYQSEISEFLFLRLRDQKEFTAKTVEEKLCYELSESCKREKKKKNKDKDKKFKKEL